MTYEMQAAAVIAALVALGAYLKHGIPQFPNRLIPLLTTVLGTVLLLAWTGDWHAAAIVRALLAAVAATGVHSAFKNLTQTKV